MGNGTMTGTWNERKQRVYFIQCERTKAVKIGVLFEPEKRLAQLQTGSPGKLELIGSLPGDESVEQQMHAKYSDKRTHGEWFNLSEDELWQVKDLLYADWSRILRVWKATKCDYPHESMLLAWAIGFPCEVAMGVYDDDEDCENDAMPVRRYQNYYSVVRLTHSDKGRTFDAWYSAELPQWHSTPAMAAGRYFSAWKEWLRLGNDPN